MKVDNLLQQLADLGVNLYLEGDRLRFRAPEGALTPDIRAAIGARRTMIINQLQGRSPAGGRPRCIYCNWRNWVDELPKNGRIRTTCGDCGRFIGYRPADLR